MTQTIEREAKLFEAGNYPDRGIEITEEDLDAIAANTADAPIRIEHSATPFDGALGFLKGVYRKGRELFGKLCFTQAAWELVNAANAKRLSVAIAKDKTGITEVSLVRDPRIADAAVFSASESVRLEEADLTLDATFSTDDPEVERLRGELADKEAQARIDELKRAGKITPASEVFARVLLRPDDAGVVTFGNSPTAVADVFRWFLESQPKVIEFSELAPAEGVDDEPEIFAKLGVTSKQVEMHRGR